VACRDLPAGTEYFDGGLELPLEKRMGSPANLRASRLLREDIRREGYDRIITHTSLAAFFTRLALKGMKDRPRLVNVVHGYLFDDGTSWPKRQIMLGAERFTARETDLLLTMNRWDEALARRFRLGKRVGFLPGMGVDYARLDASSPEEGEALRRELGISEDAFVLLYPAEFSRRKSQEVLIRAMKLLPDRAVLVLCGTGTELEPMRTMAADLGERVRFPGQVEDMPRWYRMADAAVTASRSEGLPFNVMEAQHLGLPVAASRVKGNTDLVAEGGSGLLYPYGDAAACAACIRRLMEDPDLCARLGQKARINAEKYALDRVLPGVLSAMLEEETVP
jgi:glycosyltransferase EpsD